METIGTKTQDNLLAGKDVPLLAKGITLAKGQGTLTRGTVVGIVTGSGLAKPVDGAATDGSQSPYGILTDNVETGDGTATQDVKTTAYVSGSFNSLALTFGGADTASTHEAKLRELGIFLDTNVKY